MMRAQWRTMGLAAALLLAGMAWGQVFDVRAYGAKGDGVTDDTGALAAALGAARAANGGTVYVPPGTYIISAGVTRLTFGGNTTLAGAGTSSVLRVRNNNGNYEEIFKVSNAVQHVTIRDLRIDQNPEGNPDSTIASGGPGRNHAVFAFASFDNVQITRVTFSPQIGVWAIIFSGGKGRASVTECTFDFVRPATNPMYDNSVLYAETAGLVARDNTFRSAVLPAGRGGICAIEVHGGPATLVNNTIEGFRTGMNLTPSDHVDPLRPSYMIVSQNTLTRVLIGMLLWSPTGKSLRSVTVSDNLISVSQLEHDPGPWSAGILLNHHATLNGDFRDLVIVSNQIRFQEDPVGTRIDDNTRFAAIGLGPQGSVTNALVTNNLVVNAPGRGIIVGNVAQANAVYRNIDVLNNVFISPGSNPLLPPSARTAIVGRATIIDSHFEGNTITDTNGNTARAFAFAGKFTRVTAKGNRVFSVNPAFQADQLAAGVIAQ